MKRARRFEQGVQSFAQCVQTTNWKAFFATVGTAAGAGGRGAYEMAPTLGIANEHTRGQFALVCGGGVAFFTAAAFFVKPNKTVRAPEGTPAEKTVPCDDAAAVEKEGAPA